MARDGQPEPARALFYATVEQVIIPGLEARGLAAARRGQIAGRCGSAKDRSRWVSLAELHLPMQRRSGRLLSSRYLDAREPLAGFGSLLPRQGGPWVHSAWRA